MAVYLLLAAVLFIAGEAITIHNLWVRLAFRTVLLFLFVFYLVKKDLPLRNIPLINRFLH